MKLDLNKAYHADWLDHAKTMPDECIDFIPTDPPYGYDFMGLDWDKVVLAPKYWRECFRVLKPGAFCFVMSAPRQDVLSLAIINLAKAGFEVGFTPIYWTYASGFPKALNVSKSIDKKECTKQLTKQLGRKPSKKEIKEAWEGFRNVVGTQRQGKKSEGVHAEGYRYAEGDVPVTSPVTDDAKALDGAYGGFQPKPAVEVIIVAMKPLSEKSYTDQAVANAKGVTWFDQCRIPYQGDSDKEEAFNKNQHSNYKNPGSNKDSYSGDYPERRSYDASKGRFPANLLVSDDALNDGNITKGTTDKNLHSGPTNSWFVNEHQRESRGDTGSYSRYFDVDAWWAQQLQDMPEKVRKTFPFLIVPKPAKSEKNKGVDQSVGKSTGHNLKDTCLTCGGYIFQNQDRPSACKCDKPIRKHGIITGNFHPTVKPVKLIAYMIALGSRPGEVICDPLGGTFTAAVAAEVMGRKWIVVEKKKDNYEIGIQRIKEELRTPKLF